MSDTSNDHALAQALAMKEQQQAGIYQPTLGGGGGGGGYISNMLPKPQQVANVAIDSLAMKYCGDLFDSDFNALNLKSIAKFLAMLSLQELKTVMTDIIGSIRNFIKNPNVVVKYFTKFNQHIFLLGATVWTGICKCHGYFEDILEKVWNKVKTWFTRTDTIGDDYFVGEIINEFTEPTINVPMGHHHKYFINCIDSPQFWHNFIKYIKKNGDICNYQTHNRMTLDTVNMKSLVMRETISDIEIKLAKNVKFHIGDNLSYRINENGDIMDLEIIEKKSGAHYKTGGNTINDLSDLVTDKTLKDFLKGVISKEVLRYDIFSKPNGWCCYCRKEGCSQRENKHICIKFSDILTNHFTTLHPVATYTQLDVLYELVNNGMNGFTKTGTHHLESNDKNMTTILQQICVLLGIEVKYTQSNISMEDSIGNFLAISDVTGRNSSHYFYQFINTTGYSKYINYLKSFTADSLVKIVSSITDKPKLISLDEPNQVKEAKKSKSVPKNQQIKVKLTCDEALHSAEFQAIFCDLVDEVRNHDRGHIRNKINVYELCLKREKRVKTVPNPEYKKYIEERQAEAELEAQLEATKPQKQPDTDSEEDSDDTVKQDSDKPPASESEYHTDEESKQKSDKKKKKKKKSKQSDDMMQQFMGGNMGNGMMMPNMMNQGMMNQQQNMLNAKLMEMLMKQEQKDENTKKVKPIPPKELEVEEEVYEIVSELHRSDVEKDISTLYLRKQDLGKLLFIMETFRDNKEKLKKLGMPYKLGLLLYGEAGTGKSTTIITSACFLGKNVYYVNLRGVKTNKELKELFDYVNKQCAGGGIMVFEDIDVMHEIVHPREKQQERDMTVHDLMESTNDKLTLSYFLNLLDGTLCTDDTMFIMTTSRIQNLDSDLVRMGRVDVKIELKRCDHYQIQMIYRKFLEKDIPLDVLSCIKEYEHKPVDVIYAVYENINNPSEDPWVIMDKFVDKELKDDLLRVRAKEAKLNAYPDSYTRPMTPLVDEQLSEVFKGKSLKQRDTQTHVAKTCGEDFNVVSSIEMNA